MSTLTDPRPWPELRAPDAEEWLDWLLGLDRAGQLYIAARALDLQARAARCFQADHDGYARQARIAEAERRALIVAGSTAGSVDDKLWWLVIERQRLRSQLFLEDLVDSAWARYGWVRPA